MSSFKFPQLMERFHQLKLNNLFDSKASDLGHIFQWRCLKNQMKTSRVQLPTFCNHTAKASYSLSSFNLFFEFFSSKILNQHLHRFWFLASLGLIHRNHRNPHELIQWNESLLTSSSLVKNFAQLDLFDFWLAFQSHSEWPPFWMYQIL